MKKKRGKPAVPALHQTPTELVKAEMLPEWKRRKTFNLQYKIPGGPFGPLR